MAVTSRCFCWPCIPSWQVAAHLPRPNDPAHPWPYPNGNLSNTRVMAQSGVSSANISTLRLLWAFSLTGRTTSRSAEYGSLAAGPIIWNGVVYIQDLRSNVYAISLATGALLWKFSVNAPTLGPNGVAVEGGRVFADSPDSVFALNATTGKVLWFRDLVGARSRYLSIQPQVSDGRVYLATAAGPLPGGGTLFALDPSTGALLWQFATVPKADPGVKLAGGAWETPLVGPDGTVTYGIGNPYQSIGWGVSNPSQLLYTDSDVNLSAATGQLRWYFQALPDDFYDYDMQVSPISTVSRRGSRGYRARERWVLFTPSMGGAAGCCRKRPSESMMATTMTPPWRFSMSLRSRLPTLSPPVHSAAYWPTWLWMTAPSMLECAIFRTRCPR